MLDRKTWWPKVLRGKKACDPDVRERRDLAANRRAVVIDNDDGPDEDEEDDDV